MNVLLFCYKENKYTVLKQLLVFFFCLLKKMSQTTKQKKISPKCRPYELKKKNILPNVLPVDQQLELVLPYIDSIS